jgi:hypothetical protein
MPRKTPDGIPQIVTIVSLTAKRQINLKKAARQHLNLQQGQPLWLTEGSEILLSTSTAEDGLSYEIEVSKGNRVTLPDSILARLGIQAKSLVGLVQRPNALALKKLDIVEIEASQARLLDRETAATITRCVETNPMPQKRLPQLVEQHRDLALRYGVMGFLAGRQTLAAWQARQLLGRPEESDGTLRQALIQHRLKEQQQDGSWAGQDGSRVGPVIATARNLRELIDLGLTKEHDAVQRAADWLLARPQSTYNPGMFFAADDLVAEQARIVTQRQEGKGGRFRQIKTFEKKRIMSGDDLIVAPCGPRIIWSNGLCLDALLRAGYENHERIQSALHMMTTHDWCECSYQHGTSGWRSAEPLTMDQIAQFEASCIAQYRYGGLRSPQALTSADLAAPTFDQMRVSHRTKDEGDEYSLRMPEHTQGCEAITTRSLSRVQDPRARRFAEAHLWRFASKQHAANGAFPHESYGSGFSQAGFLELFARYDHPISKIVVLRALPWIADAQNKDGSWGEKGNPDASTLAIVIALLSLGDLDPPGMVPS